LIRIHVDAGEVEVIDRELCPEKPVAETPLAE
jgi:hypothetical protein